MGLFKLPSLVFLDFETYYNSKEKYDLRHLSVVEYVRDSRFKIFGMSIAWSVNDYQPQWINNIDLFFSKVDFSNIGIVGHNLKFDGLILKEKFNEIPKLYIDTRGLSKAILGKRVKRNSLAETAAYFNLPAKGILKTDGLKNLSTEELQELSEYCNHDVWLTYQIFNRLSKEFPINQYKHLDWTIRTFINSKLKLDTKLLEDTYNNEVKRKKEIFNLIGIDKKVFASNKQFPELLKKEGFEVPMKESPRTKKQIPAIALGDFAFREMCNSENEKLRNLCEARLAAKSVLLETRSLNLLNIGKTGTWPFDVQFSGAMQTHRYSGDKQAGGNPQNFPKQGPLRQSVEAPYGYKLIVADFDKIEARLVGYLSKDPELMRMFDKGLDTYCDFASAYYNRTITKKDVRERKFGKTAILGLGYGMGAKKFKWTALMQAGLKITSEEAYNAVNLYRSRYFRVPLLWEKLQNFLPLLMDGSTGKVLDLPLTYEKEALILPSGLKIRYPNLKRAGDDWNYEVYDKGQLRKQKLYGGKILENISQALAGELCKEALKNFTDVATGQVHDEIHLVVSDKDVDKYKKKLYTSMTASLSWFPRLKLEAEIGIGQNWLDASKQIISKKEII